MSSSNPRFLANQLPLAKTDRESYEEQKIIPSGGMKSENLIFDLLFRIESLGRYLGQTRNQGILRQQLLIRKQAVEDHIRTYGVNDPNLPEKKLAIEKKVEEIAKLGDELKKTKGDFIAAPTLGVELLDEITADTQLHHLTKQLSSYSLLEIVALLGDPRKEGSLSLEELFKLVSVIFKKPIDNYLSETDKLITDLQKKYGDHFVERLKFLAKNELLNLFTLKVLINDPENGDKVVQAYEIVVRYNLLPLDVIEEILNLVSPANADVLVSIILNIRSEEKVHNMIPLAADKIREIILQNPIAALESLEAFQATRLLLANEKLFTKENSDNLLLCVDHIIQINEKLKKALESSENGFDQKAFSSLLEPYLRSLYNWKRITTSICSARANSESQIQFSIFSLIGQISKLDPSTPPPASLEAKK